MKAPSTLNPCSLSKKAVTEESTPPDMPTRILMGLVFIGDA